MSQLISELEENVLKLGKIIAAPRALLKIAEDQTDDGTPHVELKNGVYHYVTTERGEEESRKIAKGKDELLYWVFKDITSEMAEKFELNNREKGKDFRRIKFAKQLQLMSSVNTLWGRLLLEEIESILQHSPYDDLVDDRTAFCRQLIVGGLSGGDAYVEACKKFPLP